MLVQKSVTLALKMMKLLASPIRLARSALLTEIHLAQLTVVQLLGNIATSTDKSTTALFEGVMIAQVINYKRYN